MKAHVSYCSAYQRPANPSTVIYTSSGVDHTPCRLCSGPYLVPAAFTAVPQASSGNAGLQSVSVRAHADSKGRSCTLAVPAAITAVAQAASS